MACLISYRFRNFGFKKHLRILLTGLDKIIQTK